MSSTPALSGDSLVPLSDEKGALEILTKSVFGLWETVNNLTRLRPTKRDHDCGERQRHATQDGAHDHVERHEVVPCVAVDHLAGLDDVALPLGGDRVGALGPGAVLG